MARPSGQDFPKHKGGLFGNFGIPSLSGFPKIPKSPNLCFGKSCPLGRAILEILEISEILEILEISEISEILEISEISEILEIGKLGARILEILELSLGRLIGTHPMTDHALRLS